MGRGERGHSQGSDPHPEQQDEWLRIAKRGLGSLNINYEVQSQKKKKTIYTFLLENENIYQ